MTVFFVSEGSKMWQNEGLPIYHFVLAHILDFDEIRIQLLKVNVLFFLILTQQWDL